MNAPKPALQWALAASMDRRNTHTRRALGKADDGSQGRVDALRGATSWRLVLQGRDYWTQTSREITACNRMRLIN
jgi:hypothetical protein